MARHRILCTQRSQTVVCSFLVEQHGKNILDAAFGAVSRFIQEAALKRPIFDIQDLLGAVTAGARSAKGHDPRGPKVECAVGGLWGAQGIAAAMGAAFRFQSDPNLLLDLEASVWRTS